MSRPKIVFCYRYGLLGGVSAQLLNRHPHLSRQYDVHVIFERDHGMAGRFPHGVVSVAARPHDQAEAIRRIGPDVTIVIDSPSFLEAWRQAGEPGKLMVEVHTTTTNLSYLDDKARFGGVSHFATVSSYMQRLLHERGIHTLAPITVIPNCLESLWDRPTEPKPLAGQPVLWVGKLDGHKRWRTAVDLIDQLSEASPGGSGRPVIPMLVGGLTAPVAEVDALTTRLATSPGLNQAVWLPRVEYHLMPALYTSVAGNKGVHLCTTMNESFGMAVAESLVRGCPVIAPAVGALPELLPEAALYEPDNWPQALEKTGRALTDDKFRSELLETADHVRELTRPEQIVGAYTAVFASLLG
jgi:glycosyltransferase involved in cell wall biosynthesis